DSRGLVKTLKWCPERKNCSLRVIFCAKFTLWTAGARPRHKNDVQSVKIAHPEPFSVQNLRSGQAKLGQGTEMMSRAEKLLTQSHFLCKIYALDSRGQVNAPKWCPERKNCSPEAVPSLNLQTSLKRRRHHPP
ncbi:MAG: hypothetical protein QM296_06875, partial [Bacillota bacterium]|nr:hypothetical protein [Bacillota bacterium]